MSRYAPRTRTCFLMALCASALICARAGHSAKPTPTITAAPVDPSTNPVSFELVLEVVDSKGRSPSHLTPGELRVHLGDDEVPIHSLTRMDGGSSPPATNKALPPPLAAPWQIVIYLDPALMTLRSRFRAADALAKQATALSALGSVEVILAAPLPQVRLGRTRDPKLIRQVLHAIARQHTSGGDLVAIRDRFRTSYPQPVPWNAPGFDLDAAREDMLAATQQERSIIKARLDLLAHWLEARIESGPRLLIWGTDGFDLDPTPFYLADLPESTARNQISEGLRAADLPAMVQRGADRIAQQGWTVVSVAARAWPTAAGRDLNDLLLAPAEPLVTMATVTAGYATSDEALPLVLGQLRERWYLVLASDRLPVTANNDGRLIVTSSRPDLVARAPARMASAFAGSRYGAGSAPSLTARRNVFLAPLNQPMATGRTLIQAQVVHAEVEQVGFLLDGKRLGTDRKQPFQRWIILPTEPRPSTLRVEAYNDAGRTIGFDEMRINKSVLKLNVRFRERPTLQPPGPLRIELAVDVPLQERVRHVEVFLNDQRLAVLDHPPYRHRAVFGSQNASTGYLRALVTLDNDATAETVHLFGRAGFVDEVEVDLIEIPTVVKDADGRLVTGLEVGDFELFEHDQRQNLVRVLSADDVDLTLCLTLDLSASMIDSLPVVRQAAQGFLERVLRPRDQALAAVFGTKVIIVPTTTRDHAGLAEALTHVEARGGTALHDAIILSLLQLREAQGRKALVVLTDGTDTMSASTFTNTREMAQRAGVPIHIIGFGGLASRFYSKHRKNMTRLARVTGGTIHIIDDVEQLAITYREIEAAIRSQYLLTYHSDRPAEEGWRRLEVRLRDPRLTPRAPTGYYADE